MAQAPASKSYRSPGVHIQPLDDLAELFLEVYAINGKSGEKIIRLAGGNRRHAKEGHLD